MRTINDRSDLTIAFVSPYPFEFDEVAAKLVTEGFAHPSHNEIVIAIDQDGRRTQLRRVVKGQVEIQYDQERGRLSAVSISPDECLEGLETAMRCIQPTSILPSSVKWYEFNLYSRVLSGRHPLGADRPKPKQKSASLLNQLTRLPVFLGAVTFCGYGGPEPEGPLNEVRDWVHISDIPFVPNPRYLAVRVVYRRVELALIKEFITSIPALVDAVVIDAGGE